MKWSSLAIALVELGALRHLLDALLHLRDLRLQRGAVEVLQRGRDIRQHGQAVRPDLGKAAEHDEPGLLAAGIDRHDAGPQQRDQRRVAGQHAEVALGAGHIDLIDLAGERDLVRRHELEVEGGHALIPA